jgi:hypothetical protein
MSGGPSLGRSPARKKQRHPINQDQIEFLGKTGSTQFFEQGLAPCSFFLSACSQIDIIAIANHGISESDRTKL